MLFMRTCPPYLTQNPFHVTFYLSEIACRHDAGGLAIMIRLFVVTFIVTLGLGCANTATLAPSTPPPTAPMAEEATPTTAEEIAPTKKADHLVQMCVPGTKFRLDARYMVIKMAEQPDLLFHRVGYRCEGRGIKFRFQKNAPRVDGEACHSFRVPDTASVPKLLVLKENEDDPSELPAIYTHVNVLETIFQVVAENPCKSDPVPGMTAMR